MRRFVFGVIALVLASSGCADLAPANRPPFVSSFEVTTAGLSATFGWDVEDPDGDLLVCTLDIDADAEIDYRIEDCANDDSQVHTFDAEGDYLVAFVVDDGRGADDDAELLVTVSAD